MCFSRDFFTSECDLPFAIHCLVTTSQRKMKNTSSPSHTRFYNPEECPHLETSKSLWQAQYLTEGTFKHLVAVTVINSIAIIPTIVLNALVIFVVASTQRLRSKSNILLACLAGTDLLTGLVCQPTRIAMEMKRILGVGQFCTSLEKMNSVTTVALNFASLGHLVLISIDRYIAIKKPLRYPAIITKQRIKVGVILVWATVLIVTTTRQVLTSIKSQTNIVDVCRKAFVTLASILVLGSVGTILYTYCYIFTATRRQKRLQTEQLTDEEAKRIKKDKRDVNTLGFILFVLVLTYFPGTVAATVAISLKNVELWITNIIWSWSSTLAGLGSFFNPIIYCWRMKKMRQASLQILHLTQPDNRPPAIEMQVIQRHRVEIQPTTSEPFSMPVIKPEPVLLSVSHLRVENIVPDQD